MNRSRVGSKQKYAVRLEVAAQLIAAYVKLSEDEKQDAERFLALHVYGQEGMYPYRVFPENPWNSQVPSSTYECPLSRWVKPWSDWAQEIRESLLTPFERGEAVRAMLGALIHQKDRMRLTDLDLRESAKTTLGWTRWDAKHLKELRSLGFASLSQHYAWMEKTAAEERVKGGVAGPALDE
jgi:hypothetical protein